MPVVDMTIDLAQAKRVESLPIAKLRRDGGTQIRPISQDVINDYAEAMKAGVVFPAVVAFYDGTEYWLGDGFHRTLAGQQAGIKRIDVEVRLGTQREAVLFACGANEDHGHRRTNADKRKAVETLLADEEWSQRTNLWIAESCKVSASTVERMRKERGEIPQRESLRRDGKKEPNRDNLKTRVDAVLAEPGADKLSNSEVARRADTTKETVKARRKALAAKAAHAAKLVADGHAMQDEVAEELPDYLPGPISNEDLAVLEMRRVWEDSKQRGTLKVLQTFMSKLLKEES